MESDTLTQPKEIAEALDAGSVRVLLTAAQIGNSVSDDVFISYTTLLLGLLFADVTSEDAPPAPSASATPARPAWQDAALAALDVDRILASKPGLSRLLVETRSGVFSSGDAAWPDGRPLTSASAKYMLKAAEDLAAQARGSSGPVTPPDILAAYLDRSPRSHEKQMAEWGFRSPKIGQLRAVLSGATPAPTRAGPLEGYDASASLIVSAAFALATRRRDQPRALILSEALLVALCEAAPWLGPDLGAEVSALSGMMTRRDGDSAYRRLRDEQFDMPADLASAAASVGSEWPPLTRNARLIIRDAREIAARTTRSNLVLPRHLVAALISELDGSDRDSVAATWLQKCGVSTDTLRGALSRIVRDRHRGDVAAAWVALLDGRETPLVTTTRPDTIPDDPRSQDTLGLRRYGDAIAALISASDQTPPLSIAVFGPWGSGKSFFMAMIRAAVRDYEASARKARADNDRSPFLSRIVQIEFNAWHYAEGNLWASLVHALLVGLQQAMSAPADGAAFAEVLGRLHLHEAARLEAEEKLGDAERQLAEASAALAKAEEEAAHRRAAEEDIVSAADIVRAVQDEALSALRPPGDNQSAAAWIQSVGASVEKAADYLGRPELAVGVDALTKASEDADGERRALAVKVGQIRDLLDETRASAGRGAAVLGWLANARVSPRDGLWLLAAIAFLVLLAIVAVLLARFQQPIVAFVVGLSGAVASVTTLVAGALSFGRRHLRDAQRAFAVLGSVRDRVDARQAQRLAERDGELLAARRARTEAEAEAGRRSADAEAARAAVSKAREEVVAATSPERLKRFVAQRLAEGDYQRHLGIVHTIRSDLERLQGILEDAHPAEANVEGAPAPIGRIVLYIDDLDRCAPERVVEVLEAVHLLLAFKLFVVVVGVDIRWVSQALRKRYPRQLAEGRDVASPTDYLEKVFQIPFWLPVMDAVAGRRLLEAAVGPAAPANDDAEPAKETATSTRGSPRQAPSPIPIAQPISTEGARIDPQERTTGAKPGPPAAPAVLTDEAALQALVFGEAERERLLDMAAAVGASPRRAKRFANLYRLLKASLSPAERRSFAMAGGRSGTYAGALILLAAATGAPRGALALIAELAAADGDAATLLEDAFARAAPGVPASEATAFEAVRTIVLADPDKDAMLRRLRLWGPRVTRFMFNQS